MHGSETAQLQAATRQPIDLPAALQPIDLPVTPQAIELPAAAQPIGLPIPRGSATARKPLLFALATIIAVLVADRAGSLALQQIVKTSDHRLARLYAGRANADVLILGNSGANAMVIPPELTQASGHSTFSIAVHGLDAVTQAALVRDYLALNRPPKVAIFEIRPGRQLRLLAPDLKIFAVFGGKLSELIETERRTWIPWSHVFTLTNFNSTTLPLVLQRVVDRRDQERGASDGRINEAMKRRWVPPRADQFLPQQIKAIADAAQVLRQAGTRVVIVVAPVHPLTVNGNDWLVTLAQDVQTAVGDDVKVHDFQRLFADDSYFEDPTHLNAKGRAAFLPHLKSLVDG